MVSEETILYPLERLRIVTSRDLPVEHACSAADQAAQATIGHGLFTVMRFHRDQMEVERLYSSRPGAYALGGRKSKRDSPWGQHVLIEGQIFFGSDDEAIRWAFDDSETILALGLNTVINIPLFRDDAVIGTMNLLNGSDQIRREHISQAQAIAVLLARAM